ncbi:MAG TPA: arsenate reductase ArsC [Methanoregulaceae archaeon]|nr:arsenate reductase ArsC [Methanoregulaceae archaeon]
MSKRSKRTGKEKPTVLFSCTYNSVRSQIAEGLMRSLSPDCFEVFSTGIAPAGLHPYAIKTMQEIGIDISGQRSKSVRDLRMIHFDYMVAFSQEIPNILGPWMPSGKTILIYPVQSPSDLYLDERDALADLRALRENLQRILEHLWQYPLIKGEGISMTVREAHQGTSSNSKEKSADSYRLLNRMSYLQSSV